MFARKQFSQRLGRPISLEQESPKLGEIRMLRIGANNARRADARGADESRRLKAVDLPLNDGIRQLSSVADRPNVHGIGRKEDGRKGAPQRVRSKNG